MAKSILMVTVGGSRAPIVQAHQDLNPAFTVFVVSADAKTKPGSRFSLESAGVRKGKGEPAKETLSNVGQYLVRKQTKESGSDPRAEELAAVGKYLFDESGKNEPSILQQLQIDDDQYMVIELENPDSISETYKKMTEQVIELQKVYPHAKVTIDITGGTKSMSAAGALVAIDLNLGLSVVVGMRRNLEKVEELSAARLQNNGVVELSRDIKSIEERFACRDYQAAVQLCNEALREAERKRSPEVEELQLIQKLQKLQMFANACKAWDEFEHEKAVDLLWHLDRDPAAVELKIFGERVSTAKRLIQSYYQDTSRAVDQRVGFELVYDLYFNAARRGDQQKFEDAVARLYRTLEVMGQVLLINRHRIRTNHVVVSELEGRISASLQGQLGKKCNEHGVFEAALLDSFSILQELDAELKPMLQARMGTMRNLLGNRNHSILAHGFTRVEGKAFQEFQKFVKEFIMAIDELLKNRYGFKHYENVQFPREI